MELQESDFAVADALAELGYQVVALGDWADIVAQAMTAPVANAEVAVPQAMTRLVAAGIVTYAQHRPVYRVGGSWQLLSANQHEMPASRRPEESQAAGVFLLKADVLQQRRSPRASRSERSGFVKP